MRGANGPDLGTLQDVWGCYAGLGPRRLAVLGSRTDLAGMVAHHPISEFGSTAHSLLSAVPQSVIAAFRTVAAFKGRRAPRVRQPAREGRVLDSHQARNSSDQLHNFSSIIRAPCRGVSGAFVVDPRAYSSSESSRVAGSPRVAVLPYSLHDRF